MANLTFKDFVTEELSTWDKVKKRYRQGSVSKRGIKHYDNIVKSSDSHQNAFQYMQKNNVNAADRNKAADKWFKRSRQRSEFMKKWADNWGLTSTGIRKTTKEIAAKNAAGKFGMPKK